MSKRGTTVDTTNQAQQGPVPGPIEGVVDQDRLDRLDQLADKATSQYGGQPQAEPPAEDKPRDPETGQFIHRDPPAAVAETPAEEVAAEPEPPPEAPAAPDLSAKITRKVNGAEVTRTVEEWIAAGQKVEAADRYLAESAKAFREVKPAPVAQAHTPSVEEDDAAVARAIQTGTEEDAKAAVAKLRERIAATLAPKAEQLLPIIAPLVKQQNELVNAFQTFQSEYKDVVGDPNLFQLVQAEDARLLKAGYDGSNLDRFRAAGEAIRKWRDSFAGQAMTDRQQRKATVTPLPTAAARAQGKTEEKPETARDVIADMAKARMAR